MLVLEPALARARVPSHVTVAGVFQVVAVISAGADRKGKYGLAAGVARGGELLRRRAPGRAGHLARRAPGSVTLCPRDQTLIDERQDIAVQTVRHGFRID